MAERFYSDEEAQEILGLATRESANLDRMTQSRLIQTAAELGISEEAVIAAEREVTARRTLESDKKMFRQSIKREFWDGVGQWLMMAILLMGINFLTAGHVPSLGQMWAVWPVGIWGLFILLEGFETAWALLSHDERAFAKWRRKQERKRRRAERREQLNGGAGSLTSGLRVYGLRVTPDREGGGIYCRIEKGDE